MGCGVTWRRQSGFGNGVGCWCPSLRVRPFGGGEEEEGEEEEQLEEEEGEEKEELRLSKVKF